MFPVKPGSKMGYIMRIICFLRSSGIRSCSERVGKKVRWSFKGLFDCVQFVLKCGVVVVYWVGNPPSYHLIFIDKFYWKCVLLIHLLSGWCKSKFRSKACKRFPSRRKEKEEGTSKELRRRMYDSSLVCCYEN